MTTTYTTEVAGTTVYVGPDYDAAARAWDRATWEGPAPDGRVSVRVYDGDVCVRDGDLMRVDGGRVYLNPSGPASA